MNEHGLLTISMNELQRVKVIEALVEGRLSGVRAAERLGLTTRQVRRLVARLHEHGPGGLVSGRRSRPSNKRLSATLAVSRLVQEQRDDRRISGSPSRTHIGNDVRAKKALAGLKKQRAPPPAARQKATSAQANPTLPLQC